MVFLVPVLPEDFQGGLLVHSGVEHFEMIRVLGPCRTYTCRGCAVDGDAVLEFGLGEGGVSCLVKLSQIVHAGDENILYSPVFQTSEHSHLRR